MNKRKYVVDTRRMTRAEAKAYRDARKVKLLAQARRAQRQGRYQ